MPSINQKQCVRITIMIAFRNSNEFKATILSRVDADAVAGMLRDPHWKSKGFAAWSIGVDDLESFCQEVRIPVNVMAAADAIFRGLPNELAKEWPSKFLQSITPGVSLKRTWSDFAARVCGDCLNGLVACVNGEKRHTLVAVSQLHKLGCTDHKTWMCASFLLTSQFKNASGLGMWRIAGVAANHAIRACISSNKGSGWFASQVPGGLADAITAHRRDKKTTASFNFDEELHRQRSFIRQSEWLLKAIRQRKS